MATTTATGRTALLSAAAAQRLCASTASRIVPREVTATHKLTIDGYTPSKLYTAGHSFVWLSPTFEAAGYSWRIRYGPYSVNNDTRDCISLHLELDPDVSQGHVYPVKFGFSLLDPSSGKPVPKFSRASVEFCSFSNFSNHGFSDFVTKQDLEESGCLKDDSFAVQCDITALKNLKRVDDINCDGDDPAAAAARVVVPPSDLREHLSDILWKKRGTDVAVDVGVGSEAVTFDAHGWLLAARSPIFEAELLAAKKEKSGGGGAISRIEVQGVEPDVFKAMLHYMYTDALPAAPETEGTDAVAMAGGLLAAAHRFKLERLKLMCEEMLLKRVDVDTVAETLAVAEQHKCGALKAACIEFIARPGNLKALMGTEGFEKMKATCPGVVMEIVMKQLA